jgi:hypothetical protein
MNISNSISQGTVINDRGEPPKKRRRKMQEDNQIDLLFQAADLVRPRAEIDPNLLKSLKFKHSRFLNNKMGAPIVSNCERVAHFCLTFSVDEQTQTPLEKNAQLITTIFQNYFKCYKDYQEEGESLQEADVQSHISSDSSKKGELNYLLTIIFTEDSKDSFVYTGKLAYPKKEVEIFKDVYVLPATSKKSKQPKSKIETEEDILKFLNDEKKRADLSYCWEVEIRDIIESNNQIEQEEDKEAYLFDGNENQDDLALENDDSYGQEGGITFDQEDDHAQPLNQEDIFDGKGNEPAHDASFGSKNSLEKETAPATPISVRSTSPHRSSSPQPFFPYLESPDLREEADLTVIALPIHKKHYEKAVLPNSEDYSITFKANQNRMVTDSKTQRVVLVFLKGILPESFEQTVVGLQGISYDKDKINTLIQLEETESKQLKKERAGIVTFGHSSKGGLNNASQDNSQEYEKVQNALIKTVSQIYAEQMQKEYAQQLQVSSHLISNFPFSNTLVCRNFNPGYHSSKSVEMTYKAVAYIGAQSAKREVYLPELDLRIKGVENRDLILMSSELVHGTKSHNSRGHYELEFYAKPKSQ